ncbi:hypothetical protein [Nibrella viscosa]
MGQVKNDVDARQVACFVLAGYNGIRSMVKLLGPSYVSASPGLPGVLY